jgi:hypothetical protein
MHKLLPRRNTVLVRRAMCSRVARVGTQASFDAEQKNRHQTHCCSHSARMPNIRRARARTLSAHPDSRSRGECSAMCGGSMTDFVGLRTASARHYEACGPTSFHCVKRHREKRKWCRAEVDSLLVVLRRSNATESLSVPT